MDANPSKFHLTLHGPSLLNFGRHQFAVRLVGNVLKSLHGVTWVSITEVPFKGQPNPLGLAMVVFLISSPMKWKRWAMLKRPFRLTDVESCDFFT